MYLHGCKQTPATPPTTSDEDSSGSTDDGEMKKKKGNRAMGKKKFPKAKKYYTKAIKIDPENPTYRLNRAIANASLELWKDAEADAASAVELGEPPSAKGFYQLARARLKCGKLDEAEETLNTGLEAYPEEAAMLQLRKDVDRHRAAREAKERRAAEAVAEAKARAAASPDGGAAAAKALLERARGAYGDSPEECLKLCASAREAATVQDTDEAKREEINACSLQGKTALRLKQFEGACEAFARAAELQEAVYSMEKVEEREALANAYNNWGIALKNSGKMSQAIEALNRSYATATNHDDQVATTQVAQVLQNLAQCLVAQDKMEDARKMYARALEVGQRLHGPEHASHGLNHMCIARCLRKEGRLPDAIRAYTAAYEMWQGKDPEVCLAEMPEVPNKERLLQVQEQCRQELAQLVLFFEEAKRRHEQGNLGSDAAAGAASAAPPNGAGGAAASA
mmetsp:Transcript_80800/g.210442  ORF Transcript_80800/g.210442 Transcript_80800/m.210442 type:complete len:455 (+) Transcript_80800:79-1443(+)